MFILFFEYKRLLLWLKKNKPEEFDEGVMNQTVLDNGNKVGYLAMGMFGDFVEVPVGDCGGMIAKTKEFLSELLRAGNRENKEYLMVDQLLPSSNLDRFWKFFEDDIKAIVVERDPRDLYILEKCVWKGTVIPTENAEVFCKWYKYTRAHRNYETFNPEHALLIQFEDLIYKYDEATKVLRDFLGLDEEKHIAPLSKLDPSRSIKNTRLWEKYDIGEELSYIENKLKDYLYDYSFLEVNNEN